MYRVASEHGRGALNHIKHFVWGGACDGAGADGLIKSNLIPHTGWEENQSLVSGEKEEHTSRNK